MYILLTYDVNTTTKAGAGRLRRVAKCCQDYGRRVQNSVFECMLSQSQFIILRASILSIIDPDTDSVRIYNLGKNHSSKIEHLGKETTYDIEGTLIV